MLVIARLVTARIAAASQRATARIVAASPFVIAKFATASMDALRCRPKICRRIFACASFAVFPRAVRITLPACRKC